MQHKTFFGKLLAGIVSVFGSIFTHVLSGAEKTFNELPEATKDALIHGSGIMDIFNQLSSGTPDEIKAAISAKFPDVDPTALEKGLFAIAHAFNLLPIENDLNDCILKLQAYLNAKTGNVWEDIMHSASLLLATILSPVGTKLGALANLVEYVYQTFFKKN